MIYIVINALPIVTAALASIAFGAIYYSLIERKRATPSDFSRVRLPALVALVFIAQAWFAAILAGALILAPPEADSATMAIASALIIWIGFIVPVVLITHRYRALSNCDALIDCGHWLGVTIVQALVLHASGLQMPPA